MAVLMAAATVATTVAPTVANADTKTYSNQSLEQLVDVAKKALDTKFADSTNNGYDTSTSKISKDDEYTNSRYAVILKLTRDGLTKENMDKYILSAGNIDDIQIYEDSKYAGTTIKAEDQVASKEGELYYVVKDTSDLYTFLEKVMLNNKVDVTMYVVDKGATDDNKSIKVDNTNALIATVTDAKKDGDVKKAESEGKFSLQSQYNAAIKLMNATYDNKEKLNFIKEVKAYTKDEEITANEYTGNGNDDAFENVKKVVIKTGSDKKVTLKVGDKALDFAIPTKTIKEKDANTQKLVDKVVDDILAYEGATDGSNTVKPSVENADSVYKRVSNFKAIELEDLDGDVDDVRVDVATGDTTVYTLGDVTTKSYTLPEFYTSANGYTNKGEDFVNNFHKFNKEKASDRKSFNLDGVSYKLDRVDKIDAKDAKIEVNKDGKYELQVKVPVVNANDVQRKTNLLLTFTSDVQKDLVTFKNDLLSDVDVVAGHFNKLAGADRYQTAIEISKDQFDGKEKDNYADTVVITGGKALLDGLSAAPLASANNAALLLASPTSGLSQATIDEIDRVTDGKLDKKTVYIVGGYNSVPASVDKVLKDKFGATVIRLAGDDRYATSKQVAERLVYDNDVNGNVFYVGGNGAADAMSIAPVASTKNSDGQVAPILVSKNKELDQQTRNFLMTEVIKDKGSKQYVIGGLNSLGTAFYKDASAIKKDGTLTRLAGDDRYATNVKVLKEFYKVGGDIDTKGVFIASGSTNYLVDAQTAGSYAATKKAPIVLAGSKLTDDQIDLMKDSTKDTVFRNAKKELPKDFKKNVYQIGGVVSADVMKVVVDKFDLN